MQKTIAIPVEEYNQLKHKADILEEIMDEEGLTMEELEKIKKAEKSGRLTEEEFYEKHPEFRHS